MRKQEFENLLSLKPVARYNHFITKVADFEEFFVLKNEKGDIAKSQIDEMIVIHFWSATEFAELFVNDEWENYVVSSVSLDEFRNNLAEFIHLRGYLIDVFPVSNRSGFVVSLDEFVRDLEEELEKY